jgi:hypothetical protein
MNTADIMNQLGLLKRVRGKGRRVDDILYNRDGTIAEVTMYCGLCKRHYVYEGSEDIPTDCPECNSNKKWRIAARYLYNDGA